MRRYADRIQGIFKKTNASSPSTTQEQGDTSINNLTTHSSVEMTGSLLHGNELREPLIASSATL
jgi:hypothetical protein